MRGWTLICAGALLGASACGGLLIVEEPRVEGSRLARCDDSSDCDLGLVCAACDDHLCCVDSPGACGPLFPDGDCPRGQTCSNGVCVDGDTSWCDCQPDEGCDHGVCVDVDTGNQCSALNPDGVCREGHVCNGGSCVPCTENNGCTPNRPNGCCPGGAVCEAGRCYGEAEEVCSPTNTDGVCPAGQACNDQGFCEAVECSKAEPFGVCNPGSFCDDGACVCIPCSLDNLGGCCPDQEFCSLEGYCIEKDTCRVDFDCGSGKFCSVTEVCLTPPACADPADCPTDEVCVDNLCTVGCTDDTPCGTGYHCNGTVCVFDTCASLSCVGLNRVCDDTGAYAVCTTCVTGHHEDQGQSCVPDTCAEANCAAENRNCNESGPDGYAVCTDCLAGYTEVNGVCGYCLLTEDCAAAGHSGHYCSAGNVCSQDCVPPDGTCVYDRLCSQWGRCVPQTVDSDACAAAVAEGELVEPIVMLVVDQSGSMAWEYDDTRTGESRWGDLVDVLFNQTDGVVWTLQDQIQFGMTLYTNDRTGACPDLLWEYPAPSNYDALSQLANDHGPDAWTPTGESVVAVTDYLATLPNDRPKYILLATDGEPNLCRDNGLTGTALAAKAAAYAFAHDVRLFMLSVGQDIADDHMQDVANAGAGCPLNSFYDDVDTCNLSNSTCLNKQNDVTDYSDYDPWVVKCPDDPTGVPINHPFYKATSRAKLIEDMNTILGSVLSCVVRLNVGNDPPVSGNVYVDGETIPQDQPDGWMITGPDTVQLLGATCDAVTDGQSHFIAVDIDVCDNPE